MLQRNDKIIKYRYDMKFYPEKCSSPSQNKMRKNCVKLVTKIQKMQRDLRFTVVFLMCSEGYKGDSLDY